MHYPSRGQDISVHVNLDLPRAADITQRPFRFWHTGWQAGTVTPTSPDLRRRLAEPVATPFSTAAADLHRVGHRIEPLLFMYARRAASAQA